MNVETILKQVRHESVIRRLNNKQMTERMLELLCDADIELSPEQPYTRDGEFDYYRKELLEKEEINKLLFP